MIFESTRNFRDATNIHLSKPQKNLILIERNLQVNPTFMIFGDCGFEIERGERNGTLITLSLANWYLRHNS